MKTKGYFIFKGNVYDSEDVLRAILENPKIKVSMTQQGNLIIDNYVIKKINEPVENIVKNLLCFKGLAYCCSLEKPCSNRDLALELLGISKYEYRKIKERIDREILERRKHSNNINYFEKTNVNIEEPSLATIFGSDNSKHSDLNSTFIPPSDVEVLENANLSSFFGDTSPFADNTTESQNELQKIESNRIFGKRTGSSYSSLNLCKNCGCTLSKYAKFCPNCGAAIADKYNY
ncbi:MAG: zinc ribbon domain-containing protein [Candidatus Odinarchaeia archaeon]